MTHGLVFGDHLLRIFPKDQKQSPDNVSSSSQHRGGAKVAGGRLDLARKEGTKGGAFFLVQGMFLLGNPMLH